MCTLLVNNFMIISHDYKFIFIKTRKTAGSSIEKCLLKNIQGSNYIFAGMPPEGMGPVKIEGGREHEGWKYIKQNFPNEWKSYYKFTVERNSWDKVVSLFYYYKNTKLKKVKNGFEAYVKHPRMHCFKNDWDLYSNNMSPVVDDIIQYSSLNNDFSYICKKLTIPYNDELLNSINLKGNYRLEKNYRNFYTEETKDIVGKYYANPIKFFDYKF